MDEKSKGDGANSGKRPKQDNDKYAWVDHMLKEKYSGDAKPDFTDGRRSAEFEDWLIHNNEKYVLTERDIPNIKRESFRFIIVLSITGLVFSSGFSRENPVAGVFLFIAVLSVLGFIIKTTWDRIDAVRNGRYSAYMVEVMEKFKELDDDSDGSRAHRYLLRVGRYGELIIKLGDGLSIWTDAGRLYKQINDKVVAVVFFHPKGNVIKLYPVTPP